MDLVGTGPFNAQETPTTVGIPNYLLSGQGMVILEKEKRENTKEIYGLRHCCYTKILCSHMT